MAPTSAGSPLPLSGGTWCPDWQGPWPPLLPCNLQVLPVPPSPSLSRSGWDWGYLCLSIPGKGLDVRWSFPPVSPTIPPENSWTHGWCAELWQGKPDFSKSCSQTVPQESSASILDENEGREKGDPGEIGFPSTCSSFQGRPPRTGPGSWYTLNGTLTSRSPPSGPRGGSLQPLIPHHLTAHAESPTA